MKRASFREIVYLNTYWIGLSFMWNSLHVIILPAVLLNFVPETYKNTYLGILTFIGLVIAMIVQPISGSLSDRWRSSWGRRRPLILLGTVFDFLFLAFLAWAGGLWWLVIGYLGLQLSSNIAHGPAQGLLPDRVPSEQLGVASGVKNLMDMLGLVISSFLIGRFVSPDVRHPISAVSLVAVILAVGAILTLLGIKEEPSCDENRPSNRTGKLNWIRWLSQLRGEFDQNRSYWWLIGSRFAFLLGIYGVQTFAQYYVRDVLTPSNPVQLTGDLLGVIALGVMGFSLLSGWLGDRFGHKNVLMVSCGIGVIGFLSMIPVRTPGALLIFGSILGIGTGLFITANWALANKLAPSSQAGKYLGLTNLATGGSAAAGRLLGPLIDFLNHLHPGAHWGYMALFLLGALFLLVSAWLLRSVFIEHKPLLAQPASPSDI
jgi:MFS family permease